jgi:dihydropteroate synthase
MNQLLWQAGRHVLECDARTQVMGILNVTPDSFSDGGRFFDQERAVSVGIEMVSQGADIIDVGGESTRPGAERVSAAEELDRVLPVIKRLAAEIDVPISVDTRKPEVAGAALDVGASIVNDVTAGAAHEMFEVVRSAHAGMVLMHMRGEPATMSTLTDYDNVVEDVRAHLSNRLHAAVDAGIDVENLVVDPGLGFAKTTEQSLLLMKEISSFLTLGRPVLAGPSRKSFVGRVLNVDVDDRLEGTAGAVAWLVAQGVHVIRVHDVREMVRVVRMVDAIRRAGEGSK